MTFRVVKREFSLIAKGTPGRREVDARLHCIVVGGVADGFAAAVLLTLAVVVTALQAGLQMQVVETLGDIERTSDVIALGTLRATSFR